MAKPEADQLARELSFFSLISLALSDITPMASLLVTAGAVLTIAGSAGFWAFGLGCLIAITVAMCMAELGSMYPTAGGLYNIVHRVLGRPLGFLAMVDYVCQGIFIPATLALGIGTYLHSLSASISVNISSAIAMAIITLMAVLRIHIGAIIISVCLAIEFVVLITITASGLFHWNQPLSIIIHPVVIKNGTFGSVAGAAIVAAIAASLFSVNGYDSAINFSEEVKGKARNVGRAVMIAALVGIVFEFLPFTFGLFGTHNLKAYLSSSTPFTDLITNELGSAAGKAVTVGALFAIANATLAITMQFARVLWSSGRDKAWPNPVNELLGKVHPKFKSPWVSTIIIGMISTLFCLKASLVSSITFTAVLIVVLYALIAIASIVSRIKNKDAERPYKMILWPLAPIVTIIGVGLTLSQQKFSDVEIVGTVALVSLVYYFFYLHRTKHDRWVPHNPVTSE